MQRGHHLLVIHSFTVIYQQYPPNPTFTPPLSIEPSSQLHPHSPHTRQQYHHTSIQSFPDSIPPFQLPQPFSEIPLPSFIIQVTQQSWHPLSFSPPFSNTTST